MRIVNKVFLLFCFLSLMSCQKDPQIQAAYDLIERITPGTRTEFNFDQWLTDARAWGTTDEERNLFEKNASSLVTIWGGQVDVRQFDYSWREWTGLIERYYLPNVGQIQTIIKRILQC